MTFAETPRLEILALMFFANTVFRDRNEANQTLRKWFIPDVKFTILAQRSTDFLAAVTVVGSDKIEEGIYHCIFYVYLGIFIAYL